MSTNTKALKSGIWYTIANFLVRSIGFITTPIFTRLLTQTEFGTFNTYNSWLSIITIFVTLNLESTLISAKYDYKNNFDEYIFSVLSLSSVSAGVWFIVVNIFSKEVETLFGLKLPYINAMLLYLLFAPAVNLFQVRERYYFEYKKNILISLILSIGTAIVSMVLVIQMDDRLAGRVIGSIIPTVILGAIFYVFFAKHGRKIKIIYWKYALPICLPYVPHLLSMTLLNSTDRVMIDRWCGAEATALYSLAYNCGAIVTILLTSLNNAFAPWIGEKLAIDDHKIIRQFTKTYITAFAFGAVGIMLVAPETLMLLGGRNYMSAIYVMPPVSMGCICQFLYTLFVNVEQFKKKTIGMAIASVSAALVNLVLNYIFIPKLGYYAAAYTTLVGFLCLLLMHMFLVYRLNLSDVYSYKFVGMIVLISLFAMAFITILYSHILIRYFTIGIYILILMRFVLKYRNQIIRLLKKIMNSI